MPIKLATTVTKIAAVVNLTNSALIREFYEYMKCNDTSERNQNNNLKVIIPFANFLGPTMTFYDIQTKELIVEFLKSSQRSRTENLRSGSVLVGFQLLLHFDLLSQMN